MTPSLVGDEGVDAFYLVALASRVEASRDRLYVCWSTLLCYANEPYLRSRGPTPTVGWLNLK